MRADTCDQKCLIMEKAIIQNATTVTNPSIPEAVLANPRVQ